MNLNFLASLGQLMQSRHQAHPELQVGLDTLVCVKGFKGLI